MTKQYLSLVQKILKNGVSQKTRNGYTIATIGETLRFPLRNHKMPLLSLSLIHISEPTRPY